jgi:hypothetical protein
MLKVSDSCAGTDADRNAEPQRAPRGSSSPSTPSLVRDPECLGRVHGPASQ